MSKEISKQELEKIGKQILNSVGLPKNELSKVLDSPTLFSAIQQKINAERQETLQTKTHFGIPVLRIAIVFGSLLALFSVVGLVYFTYRTKEADQTSSFPKNDLSIQHIQNFEKDSSAKNIQLIEPKPIVSSNQKKISTPKIIKAVELKSKLQNTKNLIEKPDLKVSKIRPDKKVQSYDKLLEGFNPIIGKNNDDLRSEGSSIVRVNLSRSELLAIGIGVLNDVGDATIQTELLIGKDGEPRAFRFVN